MKFRILQKEEVNKDNWDNFVYQSSMGWAYFLYDLIGLAWDKNNPDKSFAIEDEQTGQLYMICQLHEICHNKKKDLFSRWGFCIKDDLTKKEAKNLKLTFEDYIDSYIKNNNINCFSINLPPLTEANLPKRYNFINPLIFYNFAPSVRYTYVVDLSKNKEKMLAECEETTRQVIRKYDKSDKYSIIESKGNEEDCKIFIELHKETFIRTHGENEIKDDSYNRYIFQKLIPNKICKVFFLKDNELNKYIATVAILIYKNTAYYWWGASKNEKETGINKYLLFKVICNIRKQFNNTGYFETGGANPQLREGKFKGLNDFKKCFGTFLHPIFTGQYVILSKPQIPHKVINILGIKIKYKDKSYKN